MNKDLLVYGDCLMDDALTHWPKDNRSANVYELNNLFIIVVDVAGERNIKVSLKEGLLKIEVDIDFSISPEAKIHIKELSEGKFCRFFTIPNVYDGSRLDYVNCNGILRIRIPKF